jgi:hypothetical protein
VSTKTERLKVESIRSFPFIVRGRTLCRQELLRVDVFAERFAIPLVPNLLEA